MFCSKKLIKFKNIRHGFFNREGGVSKGIYKSLNCGPGSKDKINNIKKNIEKVCKKIGCNKKNLILLDQVHSNIVHNVNRVTKKKLKGDSLITGKKGIALGILTADCAPVFIYDPINNLISALHAGWKGAFKQIISKTIKKFKIKGSNLNDLIVVIGPCISKNNYEVKKDFLNKFIVKEKSNKNFFNYKNNKIFFSLNDFIKKSFLDLGIKNIEIIKKDTYILSNNFFSARRSLKKKLNDYGRNISVIMIK
jgi:YfiH family protein